MHIHTGLFVTRPSIINSLIFSHPDILTRYLLLHRRRAYLI